jgi:hypothetical protein
MKKTKTKAKETMSGEGVEMCDGLHFRWAMVPPAQVKANENVSG